MLNILKESVQANTSCFHNYYYYGQKLALSLPNTSYFHNNYYYGQKRALSLPYYLEMGKKTSPKVMKAMKH